MKGGGAVKMVQQPRIDPSTLLGAREGAPAEQGGCTIEDPVYWTDYCGAHFHAKSHVLLSGQVSGNFGSYAHGMEVMKQEVGEDMIERVRWFAEECDSIQGFMLPVDVLDGFGGCASLACQTLVDDFRRPLLTNPYTTGTATSGGQALNLGLTLHALAEASTTVLPVVTSDWQAAQMEALVYDASKQYHTSAVAALALTTATLPLRLFGSQHVSIAQQGSLLSKRPKMTISSLGLWQPVSHDFTDLLGRGKDDRAYSEVVVQRWGSELSEGYDGRCGRLTRIAWDHRLAVPTAFPQVLSVPSSAQDSFETSADGLVTGIATSTRTLCGRKTGTHIGNTLDGFTSAVSRDRAAVNDLMAVGLEQDELLEIQEALTCMVMDYEDPDDE
eukprot:TRINITY_DN36788_c0_g1_i1.p1 TRINITY_DN36788_c0_g1~~TRINITY_DN36788_c0_g1_i1.p1  ORF type:complete len:386 (+),score=76.70 TRINITY_DN36788_c0_g1_i1:195-1352(+)